MFTKNAIVTGSSRGIGRAIAIALAKEGYNVLINSSKSKDDLLKVQEEVVALGAKCEVFVGNIGTPSVACDLFKFAKDTLGDVHVLINNAGISHVGLLQDMSFEEWDNILNTNISSIFNMCKCVIPDMVAKQAGKIINISSVWGLCGASCETAYSATKGAINSFTKALGKELAPSNIQVNAIACGAVNTTMNGCFSEEELNELACEIPIGRLAEPDEVASMVIQLINSPAYLTGEIIKMDGGWI